MGGITGQVAERSITGRFAPLVIGHDRLAAVLVGLVVAQAGVLAAAAASGRIPEVISTIFRALLTL